MVMESFLQDIPLDDVSKQKVYEWKDSFTKKNRKNKPLVITGVTGIGKTFVAKRILQGTDIIEITESKKIIEQLDSILTKRNIQMMFQTIEKSVLIDNVSKKSKYNLKDIATLLKTPYKNQIIIILDDLNAIKLKKGMNRLSLDYTECELWSIVNPYIKQWNVTLSEDNFYKKIKQYGKNLHNILSEIRFYKDSTIKINESFMDDCEKDNIKNASKILNNSQGGFAHYPQTDIILLNIIHNCIQYDSFSTVYHIYERYMNSFQTKYSHEYLFYCIQLLKESKSISIEYNKYISYSLIYLHIKKNKTLYKQDLLDDNKYYHKLKNSITF